MSYMDGITDCPSCGKPDSAWEGQFCGECEEKYQREMEEYHEEERLEVEAEVAKRNAAEVAAGAEFGTLYAKQDELGSWYVARAEV